MSAKFCIETLLRHIPPRKEETFWKYFDLYHFSCICYTVTQLLIEIWQENDKLEKLFFRNYIFHKWIFVMTNDRAENGNKKKHWHIAES